MFSENNVNYFKINNPIRRGIINFNVNYGYDGKEIDNFQKYLIPGFSLDFLVDNKIIKNSFFSKNRCRRCGGFNFERLNQNFKSDFCKSVLIEVNEDFESNMKIFKK